MIELHVEDAPSATLTPDQAKVIQAVSPTIDAERTEDGALLTIHDIDGTETITVYDGEPGPFPQEAYDAVMAAKKAAEEAKDDAKQTKSEMVDILANFQAALNEGVLYINGGNADEAYARMQGRSSQETVIDVLSPITSI